MNSIFQRKAQMFTLYQIEEQLFTYLRNSFSLSEKNNGQKEDENERGIKSTLFLFK